MPIKTMWQLVWLKGKRHSPAAKAYLEFLSERKEALAKLHFEWYM
ncbi:hypothetical protein [Persicobacter sp. CCB-QB2]